MDIFHIEPEMAALLNGMSDEEIRAFADTQEDPASDAQIELFIYICFLIFTRTASMDYLNQAIQRAEGWVAVTADDHPQCARRSEILDAMLARMCEGRPVSDDVSLSNLMSLMRGRLVYNPNRARAHRSHLSSQGTSLHRRTDSS
jgi:hypothetical protein